MVSGDTRFPGEKLWEVREVTGYGWYYRQHGHTRAIFATSRKTAKDLFIKAGYKQFKNTRLTAVSVGE